MKTIFITRTLEKSNNLLNIQNEDEDCLIFLGRMFKVITPTQRVCFLQHLKHRYEYTLIRRVQRNICVNNTLYN